VISRSLTLNVFLDGKLGVGVQCWGEVRKQDTPPTQCTHFGKRFEETTFPSVEPVIDGRGGFTNAPFIKANTTTGTHCLIDRLDATLEVTTILSVAKLRPVHICTYFGDKLICLREHVQPATKNGIFHSVELGTITGQGLEEVPCIKPRFSYK